MTAEKRAKELGCEGLTQVSELTGIPYETFRKWHKRKPEAFDKICKLIATHKPA